MSARALPADLKPPLAGPAPQRIEDVGEIRGSAQHPVEVGCEDRLLWNCGKEFTGQDRIEQSRMLRQSLGEARRAGHDVRNQRQEPGIGVEQ
jgi:hypothetical protein